jgi:hypothetical protein
MNYDSFCYHSKFRQFRQLFIAYISHEKSLCDLVASPEKSLCDLVARQEKSPCDLVASPEKSLCDLVARPEITKQKKRPALLRGVFLFSLMVIMIFTILWIIIPYIREIARKIYRKISKKKNSQTYKALAVLKKFISHSMLFF